MAFLLAACGGRSLLSPFDDESIAGSKENELNLRECIRTSYSS